MIDAVSTALSGLSNATQKIDVAARNVADAGIRAQSGDGDGLIRDVVDISIATTEFKANAEVLKVTQELSEELLSIFDEDV